jgi:hypothetical protein
VPARALDDASDPGSLVVRGDQGRHAAGLARAEDRHASIVRRAATRPGRPAGLDA